MDFGHGRMRMDVEGDRLSSLPNDVIHKILCYLDMKDAIGTSVLSSRWRPIWTTMPNLNFTSQDFSTLPKFSKFVTHVLSRRNNSTQVYSVKLTFRGKASQAFVKRILSYAFSHNIQQLDVVCLLENDMEFPLSLFTSKSLKHLSLTMRTTIGGYQCYLSSSSSTWELPSLTTLDLHYVTLRDDCIGGGVFAKCTNLEHLTLKGFRIGSDGFSICHPRLSNLTLEDSYCGKVKVLKVAAPQLENLTIRFYSVIHVVISAPDLTSLFYEGTRSLHLSTDGFRSLEKVNICLSHPENADAHQILCQLQQLHNVHFLTLNLEIVELLSSSAKLFLHQNSPFVNLKRLKIYPYREYWWEQAPFKVAMSTELKSYLLDSSPQSTYTMVLREEIKAREIMAELRVILEKEKDDDAKANRAMESHKPKKLKIGGNMAQIKSCWENLGVQTERMKEKACLIISKLQSMEELLIRLPASNRSEIQTCFSSMCAQADIAISKITDSIKIQYDENQNRFHQLATTLEPSS